MAVTPPAGVLDGLDAAVTAARTGRGDRRDLRWTGPEDWHVTLAFLGEVPGSAAERLTPGLGQLRHYVRDASHCKKRVL